MIWRLEKSSFHISVHSPSSFVYLASYVAGVRLRLFAGVISWVPVVRWRDASRAIRLIDSLVYFYASSFYCDTIVGFTLFCAKWEPKLVMRRSSSSPRFPVLFRSLGWIRRKAGRQQGWFDNSLERYFRNMFLSIFSFSRDDSYGF